jgi:2-polyprenyl-3-methyl-5-hydroxy-6-metoxy-1,4-benzoquinol methylase
MCDFNAEAETYTADPHVDKFGQEACERLKANFPECFVFTPGSAALDFGTGGGSLAFRLKASGCPRVVALDPAENMIKVVKRRIQQEKVRGVVPFVGTCHEYVFAMAQDRALLEKFDLITASSVLAFVSDKVETIRCLSSMLRGDDSRLVHWDWRSDQAEHGRERENVAC